jgi:hypothetical protein
MVFFPKKLINCSWREGKAVEGSLTDGGVP